VKLGRRPARYSSCTIRRAIRFARHIDNLGPAPVVSDDYVAAVDKVTNGDWGMDGNDQYGDCTCADESHLVMLRTANLGQIVVPTAVQTLALYAAITGFKPDDPATDNGADIEQVCNFLETTGYLGVTNAGHAPVDPSHIDHVKWGVQLFGGVKLGLNLPQSAEDQFNAGQPWDVVAGSSPIGGHDVPLVKYDAQYLYCVTWGKLQPLTPAFFAAYCDEARVTVSPEWVGQMNLAPSKLNLAQLLADLADVA
jgi:hypothetical protein